MAKYRKKPVVVEAEQWREGLEDGWFVFEEGGTKYGVFYLENDDIKPEIHTKNIPAIKTLEGWMNISDGDYIITGIQGERYPCKPDIFEATYDFVDGKKELEEAIGEKLDWYPKA